MWVRRKILTCSSWFWKEIDTFFLSRDTTPTVKDQQLALEWAWYNSTLGAPSHHATAISMKKEFIFTPSIFKLGESFIIDNNPIHIFEGCILWKVLLNCLLGFLNIMPSVVFWSVCLIVLACDSKLSLVSLNNKLETCELWELVCYCRDQRFVKISGWD